jgi:hypothetical protein
MAFLRLIKMHGADSRNGQADQPVDVESNISQIIAILKAMP